MFKTVEEERKERRKRDAFVRREYARLLGIGFSGAKAKEVISVAINRTPSTVDAILNSRLYKTPPKTGSDNQ